MTSSAPSPTLNIKIGDKPHEITMYFGRLNELAELVQSYERLPEIDFDAETRTGTIIALLVPRDERGRRTDPDWTIPPDLSVADAEAVLDFAKDHLSHFFLSRLEKHLATVKASGERLKGVGSSLSGLAHSASETP